MRTHVFACYGDIENDECNIWGGTQRGGAERQGREAGQKAYE